MIRCIHDKLNPKLYISLLHERVLFFKKFKSIFVNEKFDLIHKNRNKKLICFGMGKKLVFGEEKLDLFY